MLDSEHETELHATRLECEHLFPCEIRKKVDSKDSQASKGSKREKREKRKVVSVFAENRLPRQTGTLYRKLVSEARLGCQRIFRWVSYP